MLTAKGRKCSKIFHHNITMNKNRIHKLNIKKNYIPTQAMDQKKFDRGVCLKSAYTPNSK